MPNKSTKAKKYILPAVVNDVYDNMFDGLEAIVVYGSIAKKLTIASLKKKRTKCV